MDSGSVFFPFTRPKGQFLSFEVTLFANLPHFSTFLKKNLTVMGLFSTVTIHLKSKVYPNESKN